MKKGTRKGYLTYKKKWKEPEYGDMHVPMRLYCNVRGCYNYITGQYSNYAGHFVEDGTGDRADLRNQIFLCPKHKN